jgi:hypothetical protein
MSGWRLQAIIFDLLRDSDRALQPAGDRPTIKTSYKNIALLKLPSNAMLARFILNEMPKLPQS